MLNNLCARGRPPRVSVVTMAGVRAMPGKGECCRCTAAVRFSRTGRAAATTCGCRVLETRVLTASDLAPLTVFFLVKYHKTRDGVKHQRYSALCWSGAVGALGVVIYPPTFVYTPATGLSRPSTCAWMVQVFLLQDCYSVD